MINMDAPKHTKLRLIVNRGFTPRQVAQIEESVRVQAREIVDRVATDGRVRLRDRDRGGAAAADHLRHDGHPARRHQDDLRAHQLILGVGDPEYVQTIEDLMAAGMGLFQYGLALAQDRLDEPARRHHDHADARRDRGRRRRAPAHHGELGSFFLLLVVAGNETTRNAISHGMKALTDHPDQREIWRPTSTLCPPTAVEEIVRWATPVINFRRTAHATPWSAARRSRRARRS